MTATVTDPSSHSLTGRNATLVTWIEADGSRHTGVTVTWRGKADKGEQQKIWLDAAGRPTIRPRDRSQTLVDSWAAGLGTSMGLAIPFLVTYAIYRRRCDQRRYRDWDMAWSRLNSRSTS